MFVANHTSRNNHISIELALWHLWRYIRGRSVLEFCCDFCDTVMLGSFSHRVGLVTFVALHIQQGCLLWQKQTSEKNCATIWLTAFFTQIFWISSVTFVMLWHRHWVCPWKILRTFCEVATNLIGSNSMGTVQKVQPICSSNHGKISWYIMHALLNM